MRSEKVFIVGLDCATPQLVFDAWLDDLPNIKKLMDNGVYGELESTIPPITVPAWTSMVTSRDPGELGFYGFRNRSNYSYSDMSFATASLIRHETVWERLSKAGKKVIVVGVPQTFPPRPVNGSMVSCFLTPSTKSQYTYPPELKQEIESVVGDYPLDVKDFRTEDKDYLLRQIYEMTEKHFSVIRHLMKNKEWDFFMFVEMGIDRIHHGMWKYSDEKHIKFDPHSKYRNSIKDYYKYVDKEIGTLLSLLDENTTVMVVSDHGAKKMDGGICINEWLIKNGYLKLKKYPEKPEPFRIENVDWAQTRVWGEGGYYARIFMNVKGREPNGIVDPSDYEALRTELINALEGLGDDHGKQIGTKVYRPQDLYRECNGIPPDLIALFGNLDWRSVGSIGHGKIYTFENDTGPDDANHAQNGIFVMSSLKNGLCQGKRLEGLHLMDIAPTVLGIMGQPIPDSYNGNDIVNKIRVE